MDADEAEELDADDFRAIKIQALIRRFLIRTRKLKETFQRYEKIFDPKLKRFYYYDKIKDKSSWVKPVLLLRRDFPDIAPTYLPTQAAKKIQLAVRRMIAVHRVRLLYQSKINVIIDEKTGKRTYYNPKSGATRNRLPAFMKGRLDYRKSKKKVKKKGEDESEDDSDASEESDGLSLDSDARRLRRKLKRRYPR